MSKESSIKVFAENASGTRPANAIPVWIDNISAIGGGGGGGDFDPSYLSAQIDNKLDSSALETEQYYGINYVTAIDGTDISATYASTAQKANTAIFDSYGNSLSQTHDNLSALNQFVQTNSAQWAEGGSSDTFYIYPGKTTDKEISENSGKDLKLYNSANNTFLDFAGKSTYSNYALLNFKEITGTQYNQNTLQHLRLKVYPNATSACKVYDTNSVNLLDSNSTVSQASTAYYDAGGNSLTETRFELDTLNSFVQSNSANWEGGSSPAGESVLFHFYNSYDPNYGSQSQNSNVSGATELYFEASVDSQQGTPSEVVITRYGSEIGRAYWSQVSSDGSYNFYTASYNNADGGEVQLQNNGYDYDCYVSANGAKTYAFKQGSYDCSTDKAVKFNVQGYNFAGQIEGWLNGWPTPLTSFTGSLTDFTAKGYERYITNISMEDSNNSYYYDLSAEFGAGGSTVASSDVFPPTDNLSPGATYYLGWNAQNGGLQWFNVGN